MTLPTSGAISVFAIADEFGLARNTPFPSGFYGKGGAPASGALSFADFYGRSNTPVIPTLTASAAPNPVYGSSSGTSASASCSLSVSGGVGPFTYSWARSGGSTAISPDTSGSQSITFTATGLGAGTSRTATYGWTVTDTGQAPNKTVSGSVDVTLERL